MHPSDLNRSLDDSFIFVDAGFLSKLSKYFGGGKYLIYDIINFCEKLGRKESLNCKKIFYYCAPPFQSNNPTQDERERKDGYDKFIKILSKDSKIEIREGRVQRILNKGLPLYTQKAVDTLMILDLMKVPLKNPEIKKIILIACDSDFVPVIEDLRKIGLEVILYTYFAKKRKTNFSRSTYLMKVANKYVKISKEDFLNSPLNSPKKEVSK